MFQILLFVLLFKNLNNLHLLSGHGVNVEIAYSIAEIGSF